MSARTVAVAVAAALTLLTPDRSSAQPSAVPSLTFSGGWAGFVDDGRIDHGAFGGGLEWVLTPRIAIGPEVLHMIGPDDDRDLFVLGVARIGILPLRFRVAPFVTLGGGFMTHTDTFYGGQSYSSTEGAFIAGGGVRINAAPRVCIAPEFTLGWEPHMRASVTVGIRLQ